MNERIKIRLVQDGEQIAVSAVSSDGILLAGETDAWPRGFSLRFGGDDKSTRDRMARISVVEGWEFDRFKVDVFARDGCLLISGVKLDTFPPGNYWFELTVADLVIEEKRFVVELTEDSETFLEIEVRESSRRVELSKPISEFDDDIQRVLLDTGSRIDGLPAAEWLTDPGSRARRKACLLNVLALLRATGTVGFPLITGVERVFFADVDRAYARVQSALLVTLQTLADDPQKPFFAEGTPKSNTHRKLLDRIERLETDITSYDLKSFRADGRPSLQLSMAIPKDDPQRKFYADIDIDLGNPIGDVAGFFVHLGELLASGKTDHLKLREKLAKNKRVAPFLYYVIEG